MKKHQNPIKIILHAFLDFIYPQVCFLCDQRYEGNESICAACQETLRQSIQVSVHNRPEDFHHLNETLHFEKVLTCWDFSPTIEKLIHRVKYQNGKRLGLLLGRMAGEAFQSFFQDREKGFLSPVPLHKSRHRERGYNQSEILARGMAEHLLFPLEKNLLKREKQTRTQTKLSSEERQVNVKDAFAVQKPSYVSGKTILLVDDVATTGATLNSCSRVLKNAGAEHVIGLALSRPELSEK